MRKKQVAMVVDDNQMFGDLVSKMLMRQGCDNFVCNDYESAIDMLDRSNIALFMADIFMPGMGGIEGIKKIRDMSPAATIIAESIEKTQPNSQKWSCRLPSPGAREGSSKARCRKMATGPDPPTARSPALGRRPDACSLPTAA